MDNLAHTLIGIGVARSGLSRRFGPGTTATLAIASNIPDIDVFWSILDPLDRFLLRRTHTHALLTLPLIAALLALVLQRRYREQRFSVLFGLSALGIGLHILFDLVNSYGVVVFWPFLPTRFELASVFIIDLVIWGLLLAPMLAGCFLRSEERKLLGYRLAVGALTAYVGFCVAAHHRAEAQIRATLAGPPDAVRIFPEPLGPHRFRAAVLRDHTWQVHLCSLFNGDSERIAAYPVDTSAPRVIEVRASPAGRRLDWFMAAPVWTLRADGAVEVYDLRFSSVVVPRTPTFRVEFPPGRLDPVVR